MVVTGLCLLALCVGWWLGYRQILIGYAGDPSGSVWSFWWSSEHSVSLLAPTQAIPYILGRVLTIVFSPLETYNILLLVGSVLTGVSMYYLLRYVVHTSYLAVIGGLIYALMPGRQFQMYQHLSLSDWFWYPLLLLSILKLGHKPSWWRALSVTLIAVLSTADSFYNIILIIPIVVAGLLYLSVTWRGKLDRWLYVLVSSVAFLLMMFGLAWNILFHGGAQEQLLQRPSEELFFYSAHWYSYVLPSIDHPLLGRLVYSFVHSHLEKGNVIEVTHYVTWTMIVTIMAAGIIGLRHIGKVRAVPPAVWIGIILIVVGALFSVAPDRPLGAMTVVFPAKFIYPYLPMFRVYARFGFMVAFGVVLLFILAIKHVKWPLQALLVTLVLFEVWWTVPIQNQTVPGFVGYLKSAGPGSVIDYPFLTRDEVRSNQYFFWQSLFNHPLVNQFAMEPPSIYDQLSQGQFTEQLNQYHPRFVVIHHTIYTEGRLPTVLERYFDPSYDLFPPVWKTEPQPQWLTTLGYSRAYHDSETSVWVEHAMVP